MLAAKARSFLTASAVPSARAAARCRCSRAEAEESVGAFCCSKVEHYSAFVYPAAAALCGRSSAAWLGGRRDELRRAAAERGGTEPTASGVDEYFDVE